MSRYGRWTQEGGLPAFVYEADQATLPEAEWDPLISPPTRRHWVALGNRRVQIIVDNNGGVGLWDSYDSLRWLTAPDPQGTGLSLIEEPDGTRWGSSFENRPPDAGFERVIGPTWFSVRTHHAGISLDRTVRCLEGEMPWVLIEVRLTADSTGGARQLRHTESWSLRPRFSNIGTRERDRKGVANRAILYQVEGLANGLRAVETRTNAAVELAAGKFPAVFGRPLSMLLDAVGGTLGTPIDLDTGVCEPLLALSTDVVLSPGEQRSLWFRFGIDDGSAVSDPQKLVDHSALALALRLPRACAEQAPMAEREVPWHAALLSGGACRDGLIGGHTLNQGSAYAFVDGFNGAARDPLQHALPLVYSEPDLALSVLRNTVAWATPEGDLPYALDGSKQPWTSFWQPSDQNLWALWLASEYAAATGDLAAFDADVAYHPVHHAADVSLAEHLRRQFRFFVDEVGFGEHGHVRIRNADWNDNVLGESGADRDLMIEAGESVLNSAMAAWVLPVYAGLCERLGDPVTAAESRELGEQLRVAVAEEWNGRWFRRAYSPGAGAIGDEDCWLEVQPWAILCGATDDERAVELLSNIDELMRTESPLGARVRWPVEDRMTPFCPGEGTNGGIWASINMTLIWAAARLRPDLAWDEWRRMTLSAHTEAYPEVWEGTLSGPDSYNSAESTRPGRTWALPQFHTAMQSFPVNNLHSHAQPLLAYLRLLGVEPTPSGSLRVTGGAAFTSSSLCVRGDGSGSLVAVGDVSVESNGGLFRGGPGTVEWQ